MGDEFKEIMEEVYKFLRDKIITRLGEMLSDAEKEKLFSFEVDSQIEINNSNKIIEYDRETDTIKISDGFLNTEYLNKIKLKYNDFDIEKLKNKIGEGSPYIFLEELIYFSEELKIKEKDIIKSLYIQEILKMILLKDIKDIRVQIVMEGFIELMAHEIGSINGFVVSTYHKKADELQIAIDLKEEWDKNFESIILNDKITGAIEKLENKKISKLLDEITDERRIIESTQNLDEVIDSINEVVEEISQISIVEINGKQIIKFVDENEESLLFETIDNEKFIELYHEIKKRKGEKEKITKEELTLYIEQFEKGVPLYKIYDPEREQIELTHTDENDFEKSQINVNTDEDVFVKEAIIKIDSNDEVKEVEEKEKLSDTTTIELLKDRIKSVVNDNKDAIINDNEYSDIKERFDNDSESLTIEELEKMNSYISIQEKKTNKKVDIKGLGKTKIILSIVGVLLIVGVGILVGWLLFNIK